MKNETPDRELAETCNEIYLHGISQAEFQFQQGKKTKAEYEETIKYYKAYDYTNYFDIKKAIIAEKCIQKGLI